MSRHISSPSELSKVLHLTSQVQNSIWILISDPNLCFILTAPKVGVLQHPSQTGLPSFRAYSEQPETTTFSSIVLAGRSFCDNRNVLYLYHQYSVRKPIMVTEHLQCGSSAWETKDWIASCTAQSEHHLSFKNFSRKGKAHNYIQNNWINCDTDETHWINV